MDSAETKQTTVTAHPVKSWPGAFAVFRTAYDAILENMQPVLVFLAIYAVCAVLDVMIGKGDMVALSASGVKSHNTQLFTLLAYFVLLLAIPYYTLAIADKKVVSVSQLFAANAKKYFSALGAAILVLLIFIAGIIPLAIPLIWFIPWFSMAVLIVVDKNLGPVDALKKSKQLAKDHKGKIWGLIGANIVVAILPGFLLPMIPVVGSVLSIVVSGFIGLIFSCALAILYRWLQKSPSAK